MVNDHGLVDRAFAIQFGNELGPNWFLVDVENNRFIVKYNMDLYMPKLIGGWSEIREHYGLPGDHVVYFDYVGNNSFKITLFKGRSTFACVNKFYDRI